MDSKEMGMLISLLGLQPLVKDSLNPKVCHELEELSSRLYKNYPMLYMVSNRDFTELLPSQYHHRVEACIQTIASYITGSPEEAHGVKPSPLPADTFNELERYITYTVRRKEQEKRDQAALEEISPPLSDGKAYLAYDEYKSFQNSLSDAINICLNQSRIEKLYCPGLWLEYCPEYAHWLSIIQSRKEKAVNQQKAQLEYEHYKFSITRLLSKVKSRLTTENRPKFHYPKTLKSYQPNQWCELELPGKSEVEKRLRAKVEEIIPSELSNFVKWKYSYSILSIPSASYEMIGVPCLTWVFTLKLLTTVTFYVTGDALYKSFHGINIPVKLPAGELGDYYLGPVVWDTFEGFSTPTTLLNMWADGKIENDGIEIIAHDSPFTTYKVKGYDGEAIEIHDLFRQFIIDICKVKSLSQGLLSAGMVDEMAAKLIETKGLFPLNKTKSTLVEKGENTDNNQDVIQALEALGYKKSEALQMLQGSHFLPGMMLEEKVQAALKSLGGSN